MNFLYFLFILVAFTCFTSTLSDIQFPKQNVPPISPKTVSPLSPNIDTYNVASRSVARITLVLNKLMAEKETNLVFSPLNIFQTLSSIMLGAAGETEKELSNILGISVGRNRDNMAKLIVHKVVGDFLRNVSLENNDNRADDEVRLIMGDGVFVQEGIAIKDSYIENAKNIYNSDVINVNFKDMNKAVAKINQWISQKTNGTINSMVYSVDPQSRVMIAGTLYFKGNWEYPFIVEATAWQKFYLSSKGKLDKRSVQAQMMVNQAIIPYYEDRSLGLEAIGIPYKHKEFYMYMVLPKIGVDLQNLTNSLEAKDIGTIVEKSQLAEVFYVVPKMKLQSQFSLRNTLNTLGARTLFDYNSANFSDIGPSIFSSDILHNVIIDVNEIGTIATAATSTSLNRGGYVNFRADRPFFFFIYNVKVGTMVFWGKVQKPTPNM